MNDFIKFCERFRTESPLLIESIIKAYSLLESKSLAGDNGLKIELPGGYIDIQYKNTLYSPRSQSVIDFYVDENVRGNGIGDKLIKKAIEQFDDLGAQVSSKASLHLFYKNGFRNPNLGDASYDDHLKEFIDNGSSLFMARNYKPLVESIGVDWKQRLEGMRDSFAHEAQLIYNEWVDALREDEAEEYAGGGICHYIAEKICQMVHNAGGFDAQTFTYDHVQHVVTIVRPTDVDFEDGVIEACTIDIPYWIYETGGGFSWEPIEDAEITGSDVTFYYQTMDEDNWDSINGY